MRAFHDKLCETRVLDPACGTGNFLYVALELMKRLEGEVLEALADLGGQEAHRGSRATRSTRTSSSGWSSTRAPPPSPSWCCGSATCNGTSAPGRPGPSRSSAFGNIEWDAVLLGRLSVPQVTAIERGSTRELDPEPAPPAWPEAEFIVGNPPFIGGKDIRRASATPTPRRCGPPIRT
jgi:hypothetical protein